VIFKSLERRLTQLL